MFASRKPSTRLAGFLAAGALILAGIAMTASSATASFPGVNGKIAFSRCEDGYNCTVGTIWTMNPDGSGQARLFSDPGHWDDDPSYSADGHRLVLQRCTTGAAADCGIAVVDARGHGLKQLTPGSGIPGDDLPNFSPDGTRIVFERFAAGPGTFQVWVMGSDGSNAHALTSGPEANAGPEYSPDGKRIVYYHNSTKSSQVWVMNADGSNRHPVTSPVGQYDVHPRFSPDGTRIAFARCPGSGPCSIWVAGANGGGEHQVTNSPTSDGIPAFSPDGTRIIFTRNMPGETSSLYVQALSGGSATKLGSGDDYNASWGRVPAPSIDSPPKVAGVAQAGHALTATAGPAGWGGSTSLQWLRCAASCTAIPGATAATYRPTNADIGRRLQVRQTQTSTGGSVSALSAATAPVAAEPGAKLTKLIRKGKARLQARLTCPATQSVVCNGRLTLTTRVHGHTVKVASGQYALTAGTSSKVTLQATKAATKARKLTAALVTRDDAGNVTRSKRTVTIKHR